MNISLPLARLRAAAAILVAAATLSACATKRQTTLADLCAGDGAAARVSAAVDTVRPAAGPELAAATGTRFEIRFIFTGASTRASATSCTGTTGTAAFTGTIPDRIRGATSPTGQASWRIDGETLLLDLNPGARDNNVFVALPLHGGRGHWGLSTFAGEVASGATAFLP